MIRYEDEAPRVLLEGHNLVLGAGTGIATYARVLAETVRDIGYGTDILVSSPRGLDRRDPVLSEVSFFDAEKKPALRELAQREIRRLVGAPFGLAPFEVPRTGTVVQPGSDRLAGFGCIYAVTHLLDVERMHFRRYGRRLRLELQRAPALFHSTRPAPLSVPRCPNIFTIHDIVPVRLPYTTPDDKKYHLAMIRELCRTADHIVTVSEFSRQDIIRLTGIEERRITNTSQSIHFPAAMTARTAAEVARDLEAYFDLGYKDYFLFVGAIEPKKNISRLVDAYVSSGVRSPLVIAGGLGWMYEKDLEKIERDQFLSYVIRDRKIVPQRHVRRLPYVPSAQLVSLMRGARALLFPSIYEGFGLPVLEAMWLGTAVMTSNVSSLPEIAGDAAALVDPYDIEAMAAAIRTLDQDPGWRQELERKGAERARMFTRERYAERIDELYRRFL